MAEEVPISEVLCEAMEYLSKLGSNLRQRSDTLKEKRIRKDKLRNSHAVKKAANKVLLICELSKKSLENVEVGVKKVLDLVGMSQKHTEEGGKSSTSRSPTAGQSHTEIPYHCFEYDRRKLRVAKKISIGHFTSVRVLAKKMPKSMQDKYPVYHDCKLYRIRKKFAKADKEEIAKKSDSNNDDDEIIEDIDKQDETPKKKHKTVSESNMDRKEREILLENSSGNEKTQKKKRKVSVYISSESDSENNANQAANDESSRSKNKNESQEQPKVELEEKKVTDDQGLSSKDEKDFAEIKKMCSEKEIGTKDNSPKKISKHKRVRIITDSDSDSLEIDRKTKKDDVEQAEMKSDENQSNQDENSNGKPLLKLVNINKLLKPGLVSVQGPNKKPKKEQKCKETENMEISLKERVKSKAARKRYYSSNSDDTKSDSDEAFRKEKQKEVKAFKAKTFAIKISRLPVISNRLLHKYNLKRITKNCITLCELVDSTNIEETDVLKNFIPEVETVKNALLQDSDSEEKSDTSKKNLCKALKSNNDTDSSKKTENNVKASKLPEIVSQDITPNRTNSSLEKSSEDKELAAEVIEDNGISDEINKQNNEIKSSLLNDSSSDDYQKSNKKRKTINDVGTVKQLSKEQEIKSSLLNDSSNDENVISTKDNKKKDTDSQKTSEIPENSEKCELLQDTSEGIKNPSDKSEINRNKEKSVSPDKDLNKIKSALLNDDSSNEGQKSPNTLKSTNTTPQSKRKHIMESMHAKKMLLTYSSSSETEDENLTKVLKGIKDELLKGISSDDENDLKTKCSEKIYSSDSDIDLVTRVKKKRKLELKKKSLNKKKSTSDDDKRSLSNNTDDTSSKKSDSSKKKMGQSGDSGSSSSDTQEEKVIHGLTNLKNLDKKSRRRRRVESSDNSQATEETSNSTVTKYRMPKTPLITGEGLLEAPPSSEEDAASGAESEVQDEDLPAVTMPLPGINGGSIQEHLAKDDLLEDSDSSKTSEEKQDESDMGENSKKKRRKANTISSDSEAGSSRRKRNDKDCRMSDFEDSEEDSSEPAKKSKSKRKKDSDSDASGGSSNDGKKKRRRIKQINDSDVSGSESETEGRNKHGRKNIRKVMGKSQLEEATKKAAREEKERLARIAERQKMYNNVEFDESGKPDEVVVDKVVLDFDPNTKEPLIEVDRGLVKKLKPHQANGIKFMWDACFESVKRIKKDRGSGCILAHCMGLGKTLQVVSLTHTLLTHGKLTGVKRVLVVCPLSTVLNWVNEFRMWLQHAETDYELDIYELSKFKQNSERAFQLSQWLESGGVCVLGYEMFRNLSADNPKKFKKKLLKSFQESLVDPGPDLVVCDEGHLLKNEKTSLSQSMNRVKTRRRIVLTGTPLQNNLKEYYCMVQFVKPNLLGKYNEYLNRFVNPITNGQYTDSTEYDIRIMKRRSHVLHKMLDGAVQRRDYGVLAPFLPPKHEYVLFITLTDVQVKLYQHYLDNYSRRPLPGKTSGFLFPDFQSLQRIWTHPLVLKYNSERYEIMQQKKREREEEEDSEGSLADFIDDDDTTPDESSSEELSDDLSDVSDDSRKKSKKKKSAKKAKKDSKVTTRRGTRANPINHDEEEVKLDDVLEVKNDNPTEWWIPLVTDDELEDLRNSPKLVLLFDILRQCEAIGDKLLVFSQSLYSLDLIEHFLGKVDEATQEGRIDEKLGGHVGSWSPGVDYFRLDGSTSCENRSIWCKNFNREDNPRARLFLISTRAGGLGINLVAANRVVIFDVSWNPSHDVQSIFRVYRFGQKKPCYIYRFLAMGTMEEKIYERQVTKQAISKRVIDEQQIDRHYAENDLAELYKFEPTPPAPRPTPTLPKDRLFAEMLKDHEALIYKFHEHDSLLENKEEETLTEEERKAAWEDFENEKNRPPPVPFNAWSQHNGLMGNLVAQQQQQQLAYAALAGMLRKDMPALSDDQIRNMLPLIYGANPALMQKLSELYKYPQASMMNHGMMNSMMNPNSGMGGGGTSGLQYEPPWARDMQQQNQLRLQQLMQHQNQMGAKYYAGGLGSRDPVAMALQQQRAREIMVGERAGGAAAGGAGRPRGRPPLQPRPPPAMPAAQDIVNLDSD